MNIDKKILFIHIFVKNLYLFGTRPGKILSEYSNSFVKVMNVVILIIYMKMFLFNMQKEIKIFCYNIHNVRIQM